MTRIALYARYSSSGTPPSRTSCANAESTPPERAGPSWTAIPIAPSPARPSSAPAFRNCLPMCRPDVSISCCPKLWTASAETRMMSPGKQFLNAGADEGRAGDGAIGIAVHDGPALSGGVLSALAQLVLDGGVPLEE